MVHWPGILEIPSSIHSVPCHFGKIDFGGVNMVRQVTFAYDVKRVVRILMPRRARRIVNDGEYTIELTDEYWNEERAQ
jgi:hypothetical protein